MNEEVLIEEEKVITVSIKSKSGTRNDDFEDDGAYAEDENEE